MSILRLTTWAVRDSSADLRLDVFETENPETVDLATFLKNPDDRANLFVWREEASDVEGCISLCSPQVLQMTTKLSDRKVPVLSLMDALAAAGVKIVQGLVIHKPTDEVVVADGRKLGGRRHYFQCVLARAELWGARRGVVQVRQIPTVLRLAPQRQAGRRHTREHPAATAGVWLGGQGPCVPRAACQGLPP